MDINDQTGGMIGSAPGGLRAAQYVRMSTEHQRYSTENQEAVITQYAEKRGITIVRTYADEGKSGLRLYGRDALKRLIDDVQHGAADFDVILVYDVSRWGRFQDADESAYYEYICKRAGIGVEYCAEQFANDGSPVSTIVKGVKRAMAGEYSRELSVKVFAGQCRLIELGFRQGGVAGFGLRRLLIDEQRNPKGILGRGEHKSLQTDRVILVPGPEKEVEVVQRIYHLFLREGLNEAEICGRLNNQGLRTDRGTPWSRGTVHQVLTNEKYVGNNVYNRISFKLKRKRVRNDPGMWIRRDGAFQGIIPMDEFLAVQHIIARRSRHFTDEEMLEHLANLYAERGALSGLIIDEMEGMPSSSAYRSRFGSLLRAYHLVGYSPDRDYRYIEINRALRRMYPNIMAEVTANIERLSGSVRIDPVTDLLTVNEEITVSLVITRCIVTAAGFQRWRLRFDTGHQADITVVVRMADGNDGIQDYYLLPRGEIKTGCASGALQLKEDNGLYWDAYRFDTLDHLFWLTSRASIRSAA